MQHIAQGEMALYVVGALGLASTARLEAHVVDCDVCARALATEAALELAFEQVARSTCAATRADPSSVPPGSQTTDVLARRGWVVATAGGLSLAAAWVLLFVSGTHAPSRAGGRGVVGGPSGYATLASDATTTEFDGRYSDPLDGG